MNIVKFTLRGKFAFFKKPDVNSYIYFTYGNIHKLALLGMFGAMLGYSGYNRMSFEKEYNKQDKKFPEFYEKLNKLKISIIPSQSMFSKKIQVFNNSVGYASQEKGGNLIVKEQWLENPSWDIYVLVDCDEAEKLQKALQNNNFIYLPYLGKNDHMANIDNVEVIKDADLLKDINSIDTVDSMFLKDDFEFSNHLQNNLKGSYKYQEYLPYSYDIISNKYEYRSFIYTNLLIKGLNSNIILYRVKEKNIAFF